MPRWLWVATGTAAKTRSISSSVKPSAASARGSAPATSSWAQGQAVIPCASTPVSVRVPRSDDDRGAEQRVDLLRGQRRGGRRHRFRVAGRDRHLGAQAVLLLADCVGDLRGEVLGAQRLAEDDLVDRLVDDLLEARHVDSRLARVEVDEAFELGEEVVGPGRRAVAGGSAMPADSDHLLDSADADAGEAHLGSRPRRLYVASC